MEKILVITFACLLLHDTVNDSTGLYFRSSILSLPFEHTVFIQWSFCDGNDTNFDA